MYIGESLHPSTSVSRGTPAWVSREPPCAGGWICDVSFWPPASVHGLVRPRKWIKKSPFRSSRLFVVGCSGERSRCAAHICWPPLSERQTIFLSSGQLHHMFSNTVLFLDRNTRRRIARDALSYRQIKRSTRRGWLLHRNRCPCSSCAGFPRVPNWNVRF